MKRHLEFVVIPSCTCVHKWQPIIALRLEIAISYGLIPNDAFLILSSRRLQIRRPPLTVLSYTLALKARLLPAIVQSPWVRQRVTWSRLSVIAYHTRSSKCRSSQRLLSSLKLDHSDKVYEYSLHVSTSRSTWAQEHLVWVERHDALQLLGIRDEASQALHKKGMQKNISVSDEWPFTFLGLERIDVCNKFDSKTDCHIHILLLSISFHINVLILCYTNQ